MTFCASGNSIIHAGAKPVFVDIDKKTMNIDPKKIEYAITQKTAAIMPVHLAGRPCDMDAIVHIAKKYDLKIIEDAAHAIGAEYNGRKIGTIGDATCFSFYVTKNITTIEGGLVATNNDSIASKIKIMGLHGMSKDAWMRYSDEGYKHYLTYHAGFKYNMTDVQASLGIHQLPKLDEWHKRRIEIWNYYNEAFKDLPIDLPLPEEPKTRHAKHLYTLIVKTDQ
jgi:dTDP-4-amino-4,6-dideoxygalactose transaminase